MCSYCVCSHVRQFCAYPACYIFSWWRRSRVPLGPPSWALNIYAPFRSALRSSRFVLLYVVSPCVSYLSSRSASRAMPLCVSSCVLFCVPSVRLVYAAPRLVPASCLGVSSCVSSCVSFCVSSMRFCPCLSSCVSSLRPVFLTHSVRHPLAAFSLRRRFVLLAAHHMPLRCRS